MHHLQTSSGIVSGRSHWHQWMSAGSGIIHQEMPKGDDAGKMYGFQLWANSFGIARVRWTLVTDEAADGWTKLNARRIGFPLTKAGYLVPHAYSPDAGGGNEDWHEASDRLIAGQKAAGALDARLAAQFSPPLRNESRSPAPLRGKTRTSAFPNCHRRPQLPRT